MILSRRVALNGQFLDDVHESVVIRGVDMGAPKDNIQTISRMSGAGMRVTSHQYETLDVTVRWAILIPKKNLFMRRQVFENVCSWAMQTGWLTVNYAVGRRLFIDKTIISSPGDIRDWNEEFTITFRAYNVPFWQDEIPTDVSKTSYSGGNFSIYVPGAFRTVADVEFKNTSGSTLDTFSIGVGGNTISLTGLGIANNGTLTITHGTDGLLRILAGSSSAYNKRSAGSADDLYCEPGTASVSVTTQRSGNLKVSVYGRYI